MSYKYMNPTFYTIIIASLAILTMYVYYNQSMRHARELDKISYLENRYKTGETACFPINSSWWSSPPLLLPHTRHHGDCDRKWELIEQISTLLNGRHPIEDTEEALLWTGTRPCRHRHRHRKRFAPSLYRHIPSFFTRRRRGLPSQGEAFGRGNAKGSSTDNRNKTLRIKDKTCATTMSHHGTEMVAIPITCTMTTCAIIIPQKRLELP